MPQIALDKKSNLEYLEREVIFRNNKSCLQITGFHLHIHINSSFAMYKIYETNSVYILSTGRFTQIPATLRAEWDETESAPKTNTATF